MSDVRIAGQLGVTNKTVPKALREAGTAVASGPVQLPLDESPALPDEHEPDQSIVDSGPVAQANGSARIGHGSFWCRYAGAVLLNAFTERVGAGDVFAAAGTPRAGLRFDDVSVLSAVSTVFALGFGSMEQAKHPDRAQVGPVVGIAKA
jgi:hypothetical protein